MDVKTLATNLSNQSAQLSNVCMNLDNLASFILSEAIKEEPNLDIIKSYVGSADIQMTALDSQKFIVQGLLDSLAGNVKKTSKSSS